MGREIRRCFAVTITALLLGGAVIGEVVAAEQPSAVNSAESIVAEMETVGGHLKITKRPVDDDMPLQTIFLNSVQVYQANVWGITAENKFRVGLNDFIVIDFLSGGNTECVDGHAVLGVRPNKTTWMAENINYGCAVTFAVVGDKFVITNVTYEGRRSWTEKISISTDGVVTHAR